MSLRDEIRASDGSAFPGKTFARTVLRPVFETQREHYCRHFLRISLAHTLMLGEQGILDGAETAGILRGLLSLSRENCLGYPYDPRYEDLFFRLERELAARIGEDLAGRLHIARSRNDLGIAQYRMRLRELLLPLLWQLLRLTEVLLDLADRHTHTLMPAYTHTQPAQPTTFAHYLCAFLDALDRDTQALWNAYALIDRSPLGAAALSGTGFPISRERMAELLGFAGLVENCYDAIAGVNYITRLSSALTELGVDLSRFLKDTLDFCTREYGYYRLADPYVQISSIMPQKRNPSSLEHARPMASRLIAGAQSAVTMLHNTPLGDMVDSEEQLQPVLYRALADASGVLSLLTSNFATLSVDVELMRRRAGEGFITATELADTLVRDAGLSFRESHRITASLVRVLTARGLGEKDVSPTLLKEIAGHELGVDSAHIARALDPEHFVRLRAVTGGVAPRETERMLKARRAGLEGHKAALLALQSRLTKADAALDAAVSAALAGHPEQPREGGS